MDVRCERCKTEYEFDDARITEAGVTVKCTTCEHVFKVKKKALVVTVPVKPEDEAAAAVTSPAPTPTPSAPGPADKREWKVRQASGNIFTFKELTTLQKWIVERKVSRDDEISLTGETWKRLGNIAELASFFQVVDEALKAAQLQALQSQGLLSPSQPPQAAGPLPSVPASSHDIAPPARSLSSPSLPVVGAAVTPATPQAPALESAPPPPAPPEPRNTPSPVGREPRFVAQSSGVRSAERTATSEIASDELAAAGIKKSGGAGKWVLMLLFLAALGGGGYYGYFYYWLPQQQAAQGAIAPQQPIAQEPPTDPVEAPVVAVMDDAGTADASVAAVADEDAGTEAAEAVAVATEAEDAGLESAESQTDSGEVQPASATVKNEPAETEERKERPRSFDYWMAQGDRLRMRERYEAAMDAYGRAADMGPTRAEPLAGRGLALLDLGKHLPAEAAFREALKLNSRYAVAVMGLAETYKAMGKKQQAIEQYEKYLDILPNGPEAPVARSAIERLKE